jgi:hypothetical protein
MEATNVNRIARNDLGKHEFYSPYSILLLGKTCSSPGGVRVAFEINLS